MALVDGDEGAASAAVLPAGAAVAAVVAPAGAAFAGAADIKQIKAKNNQK